MIDTTTWVLLWLSLTFAVLAGIVGVVALIQQVKEEAPKPYDWKKDRWLVSRRLYREEWEEVIYDTDISVKPWQQPYLSVLSKTDG